MLVLKVDTVIVEIIPVKNCHALYKYRAKIGLVDLFQLAFDVVHRITSC